jgi:hypothetical protein
VVLTLGAVFCLMPKFAHRVVVEKAAVVAERNLAKSHVDGRRPRNRKQRRRRERELGIHVAPGVPR